MKQIKIGFPPVLLAALKAEQEATGENFNEAVRRFINLGMTSRIPVVSLNAERLQLAALREKMENK